MRRITFILVWFLFLCSCTEKEIPFSVDRFNSSPADSIGVGCFFSLSRKDTLELFAFSDDNDSIAYISLNGTITPFKLVESKTININDSTANFTNEYNSGDYRLKVDMKMIHDRYYDTGDSYEGVMTVKNKRGDVVTKQIVGGCGC